jgi:hypothetical protein
MLSNVQLSFIIANGTCESKHFHAVVEQLRPGPLPSVIMISQTGMINVSATAGQAVPSHDPKQVQQKASLCDSYGSGVGDGADSAESPTSHECCV